MRIAVAQIQSITGQVDVNIAHHLEWIELAIAADADAIFFPELSLTNYETIFVSDFAIDPGDRRLDLLQKKSIDGQIMIAVGVPVKKGERVNISMIIFHPGAPAKVYSKRFLHDDELPYFVAGINEFAVINSEERIAPAICYELVIDEHLDAAIENDASVYLACVAKTVKGVEEGRIRLSQIASENGIYTLMANAVGPADTFDNAGGSAIWSRTGTMLAELDASNEGLLILDTKTTQVMTLTQSSVIPNF